MGRKNNVYIGKFCSIANISVYLGGNHNKNLVTTYPFGHINTYIFPCENNDHPYTNGDIYIGNDVWIADNVTIMSGVKIGDGAIIANNSHVVKDVEPYAIYGGNPAKLIKYRFSKDQIEQLLKIKWWDWSETKINSHIHLLLSDDIQKFIDKCYEL